MSSIQASVDGHLFFFISPTNLSTLRPRLPFLPILHLLFPISHFTNGLCPAIEHERAPLDFRRSLAICRRLQWLALLFNGKEPGQNSS
jgi:hypothetical protein